jgi:hypothetical protein
MPIVPFPYEKNMMFWEREHYQPLFEGNIKNSYSLGSLGWSNPMSWQYPTQCVSAFVSIVRIKCAYFPNMGRDSLVGIAARYGLDGPGI